MTSNGPFRNIRVLEVARTVAAPLAGQMLADLGAEVIKVEAMDGDPMRKMGTGGVRMPDGSVGDRSVFVGVNRNKKSISVDLASQQGADLIRRLAAKCDVFIENFKVGSLERCGLDYGAIRAVNPKVIYLSLTGFGQTGPYRLRPGMDNIIQGLSGYMSMVGEADAPPGISPVAIMDFAAGAFATIGIMAALFEREVNAGPSQHIDLSLLDSGVTLVGYKLVGALLNGAQPPRGLRTRGFIPGGVYRTTDGYVQTGCANDAEFERFCRCIERVDLLEDSSYRDQWLRTDNQAMLIAECQKSFLMRTTDEWVERFTTAGLMVGPVLSLLEVPENEQVKARDLIIDFEHASGGRAKFVRNPLRFSETPIETYRSPPLLNQHAEAVLGELLGMSESDIDQLRADGAIGPKCTGA